MCARFTANQTKRELEEFFGLTNIPDYTPRYNIAPTQEVPVLRLQDSGQREYVPLRWGLVPRWAKADTPQALNGLVNAKAETILEKASFSEAIQFRRCLIAATGFIEWETLGGEKQPHWFRLSNEQPFAFAGIWEPPCLAGRFPDQPTFAIITVAANSDVAPFHDRMPAILKPEQFASWLSSSTTLTDLQALLHPLPAGSIKSHPISRTINRPSEDRPELLQPVILGLFG